MSLSNTSRFEFESIRPNQWVEMLLWSGALVFYFLGDTSSTIILLELGGFESSPVPRMFLTAFGYAGLVLNKLLVVGICAAIYRWFPDPFDVGTYPFRLSIPVIMLLEGIWLVIHNAGVISQLL